MDLRTRIKTIKAQEMEKAARAASLGNISALGLHTRQVEKLDKLEREYEEIDRALAAIEAGTTAPLDPAKPQWASAKKRGQMAREEFVRTAREKGYGLEHYKGVLYTNGADKIIGIAYASERCEKRWWLGLPLEDYHAFVLLCENKQGHVTRFVFPKEFYNQHRHDFSRKKDGSGVEFNIALAEGRYVLKVPGHRPGVSINIYINKFQYLH